jgi:MFS family permease
MRMESEEDAAVTDSPATPATRPVSGRGHVRQILGRRDFDRLFCTRLASQCADGIFQASLAGAVLFNPERAAHPTQVAAGLAVLLLPYSLVGPFAGVLLDRWSRQRILLLGNLIRCVLVVIVAVEIGGGVSGVPLYTTALVTISVNRFFLSGLSAALPHVIDRANLVTANALSTTVGTGATTLGGAAALLVRLAVGSGNHGYATIALSAAVGYGLSALAAHGFARDRLGPDETERAGRESARDVLAGLVAGARHVHARRPAFYALVTMTVHRFCYGMTTIAGILLYRNYFHDDGIFRAGLAGLSQLIGLGAVGALLAAVITPAATRRVGKPVWITGLLVLAGVVELALGAPYTKPALLACALLLGIAAQGVKISVDTTVQESIDDDFRGRVFSVYDTLFNVMYVLAAVAGVFGLPDTGKSYPMLVIVAIGYLVAAALFLLATRRLHTAA